MPDCKYEVELKFDPDHLHSSLVKITITCEEHGKALEVETYVAGREQKYFNTCFKHAFNSGIFGGFCLRTDWTTRRLAFHGTLLSIMSITDLTSTIIADLFNMAIDDRIMNSDTAMLDRKSVFERAKIFREGMEVLKKSERFSCHDFQLWKDLSPEQQKEWTEKVKDMM